MGRSHFVEVLLVLVFISVMCVGVLGARRASPRPASALTQSCLTPASQPSPTSRLHSSWLRRGKTLGFSDEISTFMAAR